MAEAGALFDAFSGAVFIALGILAARSRPRTRVGLAFGAYAVGFGALVFSRNVVHLVAGDFGARVVEDSAAFLPRIIGAIGGLVAAGGILVLAGRLAPRARLHALAAFVALLALALASLVQGPWDDYPGMSRAGDAFLTLGVHAAVPAASAAALLAWALAEARARSEHEGARLRLFSLGLAPHTAFAAGDLVAYRLDRGEAGAAAFGAAVVAALVASALLWLVVAAREPRGRPLAFAVASALCGFLALGALVYALDPTGNSGVAGAVRVASVLVLAYAAFGGSEARTRDRARRRRGTLVAVAAVALLVLGRWGERTLAPPADFAGTLVSIAGLVLALDPIRRAANRDPRPAAPASGGHVGPIGTGALLRGRYRVERLLGEGGQGQTWLCHDATLARSVAVKAAPLVANATAHLDEARRAAAIAHPNVVQVLDVAEDGAYGLVVMELMPGGSLARRLERGRLSASELDALARDVLAGLAACHREGIVHGDVKPENVLFDKDGRAKVADFGAARSADVGTTAREGAWGTLAYLAPEQLKGARASPASDVHAAAVVIAQAATGRHPLLAPGVEGFSVADAVVRAEPRLDGAPEGLRAVLARALSKAPEERYADAGAMLAALAAGRVRA